MESRGVEGSGVEKRGMKEGRKEAREGFPGTPVRPRKLRGAAGVLEWKFTAEKGIAPLLARNALL